MTTTIRYSEIPSFLQEGSFFQSLCSEEQSSEIGIPEECFCQTETVDTLQDFAKLLRTTAFWGLPFIPDSIIRYCAINDFALWVEAIDGVFAEVNFAQDLRIVFGNNWIGCRPIGAAMHIGRTEIVKYFAPKEASRFYAMRVAASLGRIDYLELLREHGHRWDESVCAAAARTGQLDCLKYLIDNGCSWDNKVLLGALRNTHFGCIEYALSLGAVLPDTVASDCATTGDIKLLQLVVRHNCLLNADVATAAVLATVELGYRPCLQYLLENGCPTDSHACVTACRFGLINCLQILHTFNAPWDASCTYLAARNGALDILQYLHENDCPWNIGTIEVAITNGQVYCLRYLLNNGCPYDEGIFKLVIENSVRTMLCLRCLVEYHGLYMSNDGSVFIHAFVSAKFEAVQYLLDQGCPYQNCTMEVQDLCVVLLKQRCTSSLEYDKMLIKCVQIAHQHQWDMIKSNTVVTNCILNYCVYFPLCSAYFADES